MMSFMFKKSFFILLVSLSSFLPAIASMSFSLGKRKISYQSIPSDIVITEGSLSEFDKTNATFYFSQSKKNTSSLFTITVNNVSLEEGKEYQLTDFDSPDSSEAPLIISFVTRKVGRKFDTYISTFGYNYTKGKLLITRHDRDNKIIEGKFAFEASIEKVKTNNLSKKKRKTLKFRSRKFKIDYNDNHNVTFLR